ncbi:MULTISPECIES: hypothetical protein [unclassified Mesorhizobium]|uniref:hypothetical protein n=1 Tax=unclassified Mesorhizobium TaxID=325217 RepID=UPI000FCA5AF1|nr:MULTISPECIES: hypothetical protein [unclassified Mesorhizobium]RUW26343.1 hypothetical protein EOA34_08670 [Mesorhizobium sp. M4B.F.Ca.ET.013.02.1.1]RVD21168.1 hypothetical protein EN738_19735 [Mesorhizobium sp. M4B.F.Ca.ET.017.02.2.1]
MTPASNNTRNVKVPVPADPAFVYGLQLGQAMDEQERLQELEYEAMHAKQHGPHRIYGAAEHHQDDMVVVLRDMVANVRASSLDGSLVQIAVAIDFVARIEDQYPEAEKDYEVKRQFRTLERLLFSALNALNDVTGGKLTTLHKSHFGISFCDPWRDPCEAAAHNLQAASEANERAAARRKGLKGGGNG